PRSEKIASGHTRHGDELAAFAIIPLERDGQVDAMIHQEGDFERKVSAQLLGNAEAGLNRIRIIVVRGGFRHTPVRLAVDWYDPKAANVCIGERHEREFSEAYAVSPQRLGRLGAVLQRPRLKIDRPSAIA